MSVWYEVYQSKFSPLLVCGYSADGVLAGIFPLAISSDGKNLCVAGAHQGEYHGWLVSPEDSDGFILQAIELLGSAVSQDRLVIRLLPPGMPVDSVSREPIWKRMCFVQDNRRPLMSLSDPDRVEKSLRKISRKSGLNKLKNLGDLRLDQIYGPPENMEELDSIITAYDLRMGAIAGVLAFHTDPLKKKFYLELLNQKGLLNASILRVGNRWISALIGYCNGRDVCLGIIAYSPVFAQFSPATFHIFKLAQAISEQGYSNVDLTPGGAYKDRFATHFDNVHSLHIFFRRSAFLKFRIGFVLRRGMSGFVKLLGFSPDTLRARVAQLRRLRPGSVLRNSVRFLFRGKGAGVYEFKMPLVEKLQCSQLLAVDKFEDLLNFIPANTGKTLQEFLGGALDRIAAGEHCYTKVEQGRLVHCTWRADSTDKFLLPEPGKSITFPAHSAVLHEFWTHPLFRGQGLFQAALIQALRDAAAQPGNQSLFAVIREIDAEVSDVMKNCGGEAYPRGDSSGSPRSDLT